MLSLCVVKKKKKSNEQINEELPLSEGPKMALFFFFNKNSCSLLCIYFTYLANTSHVRLHLILIQPYCYLYFTGEETVA